MTCSRCSAHIPAPHRPDARFCSNACRQAAYRERRRLKALPVEMTGRPAWVRRVGKRPVQVNGRPASSTDPRTWTTWEAVQDGAGDGFGIMLGDGLGCIDLDYAIGDDGVLAGWAAEIVEEHRGAAWWIERSMSRRGVHVFLPLAEGPGRKVRDGEVSVEVYSKARFMAVSGDRWDR